jgi:hypothetical protein
VIPTGGVGIEQAFRTVNLPRLGQEEVDVVFVGSLVAEWIEALATAYPEGWCALPSEAIP